MKIHSEYLRRGIINTKLYCGFGLRGFVFIVICVSAYAVSMDLSVDRDSIVFFGFITVLMLLYAVIFIVRTAKSEIVFTGDTLDLHHYIGGEIVFAYKNAAMSQIENCRVTKKPWLGDILEVRLANGQVFEMRNQVFNKGADPAEDIFAFLKERMAGTNCEISLC